MSKSRRWGQTGWWLASRPLEYASPLLVDALESADLDLERLFDVAGASCVGMIAMLRVHPLRREGGTVQLMDAAGILKRCEIQRRDDALEMSLTLGEKAFVSTRRDEARVVLDTVIPATMRIAALGKPLSDLIWHPLLQRREYVIRKVRELGQLGIVVVTFQAPMVHIKSEIAGKLEPRSRRR